MAVIQIEVKANDNGATRTLVNVDAANERLANTLKNKVTLAASEAQAASLRLLTAQEKLSKTNAPEEQAKLALEVNRAAVALDAAQAQADQYGKELKALDVNAKKAGGSFKFLGGITGELVGALGFAGIAATAVGAGKAMLELGMKAEQNALAFETMLGSTTAAQKHLEELRDFAAKTPFEFNDLTEASKKMQAFGFSARDVIPMMTNIGDAVAALGSGAQGIDSVTRALGQMNAKQKIQAGEMLQLTEAGIPAWEYLAKAMGLSTAEVMKLSEKGLIPAEKGIQAILDGMEKDFGGLMAKQANTAEGALSNLADALARVGTNWGTKLNPVIRDFATGMANAINLQSDLNEAVNSGLISQQGAGVMLTKLQYGLLTQADVTKYLNELQKERNRSFDDAIATTKKMNETTAEADRETRRFADAEDTLAKEAGLTKEQLDANKDTIAGLNTLMAGAVGNELRGYAEKQTDLKTRAAELKTEIEKLTSAQGQQFTTQTSNGLSAAQLTLAQEKLAVAQAKLSETTDPLKQAQLAVEIEKLQGKIAGASVSVSGYIDNSKKIGELQAEYDKINGALDENAKAHEEATKRIVFNILQQQAAADGLSNEETAGLIAIAEKWGLVDKATANTTLAVSQALDELANNGDIDAFTQKVTNVSNALLGIPREITTTYNFVTNGNPNPAAGDIGLPGGDSGTYNPTPGQETTPVGGAYAAGGAVYAGTYNWVGEQGPEPFIPAVNGRILSVPQAQQALAGMMGGGGPISIYINGAQDPKLVALEVRRQLDAMGNRVDTRGRTGV